MDNYKWKLQFEIKIAVSTHVTELVVNGVLMLRNKA
jgi:hypothetical protein